MAVRLLLMPAAAVFLLRALRQVGWHPPDPVFALVLLVEACTPTAINLSVMTQLHGTFVEQMATMLFFQYIVAPLTVSFWLSAFLLEIR